MRARLAPLLAWLLPQLAMATPAAPPETPNGATPSDLPAPLQISDPMLLPVPAPARVVSTWQDALQLLRSRSTDLRSAYASVQQAEANQRIALAQVLPTLGLSESLSHAVGVAFNGVTVASVPFSTASLGLSANQTIFNYEQFYAIGTAKDAVKASQLSYDDLARTLAQGVANTLVGVVTAERVAEINRVGLRQAFELLELTTTKQRLGAATGIDVVRAQQSVETARATLVTGDESLRQAREAFGFAVGLPGAVGVSPSITLNALQADAMRVCQDAGTLNDRSDIRAARANVDVARRRVNDVWWQFLPTVTGVASASDLTHIDNVQISQPSRTWSVSAVLSVPLWDGGQRYGQLHYNQAAVTQAEQTLEAARRQAEIQVTQAKRGVAVAEEQLKVSARARELAVKNDEMTQMGYREGQLTSLELVTASEARRQAEINYAVQEFSLVKAKIAAILALANCKW